MSRAISTAVAFGMLAILGASVQGAENWPNWRGPGHNGVAAGSGYPVKWSASENVAWKVKLPGKGASTPIVWGDAILITCGIKGENVVLCYDRQGAEKWQTSVGKERGGKHGKATGANPSIVTDGQQIFAYFKSGDLACLDFTGKTLWKTNLQEKYGEDTLWWDLGTSPVLTSKHVIVAVMQSGPSFLVAFDKGTGAEAWKHDRNLNAPSEAAQSYSTPILVSQKEGDLIVALGADHVTAHDAATGKELWRVGGLNPTNHQYFRSIASPVATGEYVVAPYARGGSVTGIRLGGKGNVTSSHVAWTRTNLGADVPTPAAAEGKAYLCTDKGKIECLDAATGKTIWTGELEKNRHAYSSSPILADGKIYVTREDGATAVVAAGPEFKLIEMNHLEGETVVATPVLADGKIYLRTLENLYCIGK